MTHRQIVYTVCNDEVEQNMMEREDILSTCGQLQHELRLANIEIERGHELAKEYRALEDKFRDSNIEKEDV